MGTRNKNTIPQTYQIALLLDRSTVYYILYYRLNAKNVQSDWSKQHAYLSATVQKACVNI